MKVRSEREVAQSCPTLRDPHGPQPTRLLCPWDFPGKSTGVGCHRLLYLVVLLEYKYLQLLAHTGEGKGTPLQYSCLENPMGGGAW